MVYVCVRERVCVVGVCVDVHVPTYRFSHCFNTFRNHHGLLEESETGEEHGYHLWLHRSSLLRGA